MFVIFDKHRALRCPCTRRPRQTWLACQENVDNERLVKTHSEALQARGSGSRRPLRLIFAVNKSLTNHKLSNLRLSIPLARITQPLLVHRLPVTLPAKLLALRVTRMITNVALALNQLDVAVRTHIVRVASYNGTWLLSPSSGPGVVGMADCLVCLGPSSKKSITISVL